MKILLALVLGGQLALPVSSKAQVIIQGDSSYHSLQVYEASLSAVIAQMGRQYKQKNILSEYTAKLRGGGCISGTRITGHTLFYKKTKTTFYIKDKTGKLEEIHFEAGAPIVSARGIRPGAADFAAVMAKYGEVDFDKKDNSLPRLDVLSLNGKTWFTTLRYQRIRFVSLGKRVAGEDLKLRLVQEIWLE